MAKKPKKPSKISTNTINSILLENKSIPKSRQQIYKENYQKNKEIKKVQRRERYAKQKEQEQLLAQKYYQASNIQILLSLKEYIQINKEKHKLWLDFAWTLKDCQQEINSIEEIMRLRETAENLIKDYRETAISKNKKGQNWNSLNNQEQEKLINYWTNEKIRKENQLHEKLNHWENQAKFYEKEIELAKFHEERGKINCECWQCKEKKILETKLKKNLFDNQDKLKQQKLENECVNCYEYKQVDKESGLCNKCNKE